MTRARHDSMRFLAVLCAAIGAACKDGTGPVTPQTLQIAAGDTQTSRPGEELPISLRVRVIGSDNRPFAGAVVQWAVSEGSATVSPVQGTTNSNGEAETRVTMGSEVGGVVVRASVQGAEPVTFSSVALPPCAWFAWPEVTFGSTINGILRPLDCENGGAFADLYPFTLDTQQAIEVRLRSASFDPEIQLHSQAPWYYYVNDSVDARREVWLKAILPPSDDLPGSDYGIVATSIEPQATGRYEFQVTSVSQSAESCEGVIVMLGITTAQGLAGTDCHEPSGQNADRFDLVILLGQRIRITQSSTQFAPLVRIVRSGAVVAEARANNTGTAVLIYTGEADDLYTIHASSEEPQATGSYSLTVGLDIAPKSYAASTRTGELLTLGRHDRSRVSSRSGWPRLGLRR